MKIPQSGVKLFLRLDSRHPIPDTPIGEHVAGIFRGVAQLAVKPLHDGLHQGRAT
jgi:hypothetical protein